jgi:tripartite-type tricarboxylate transporter receptor subunit TctC
MKLFNKLSKAGFMFLLSVSSFALHAQDSKAIKIVVGFPAGGAPDALARAFADQMRVTTGANVTVENRTGASGKLAIDNIASAAADGQTVMLMPTSVLIMLPMVSTSAKFDVNKDFVALGSVAEYGFGVAVGPASGATDLKAYMAWAKANPTKNSYATPGLGTPQHFIGAEMSKLLGGDKGSEMNHVPYRGGAPALTDLLGGQIPLLITTEQLLVPHHTQGKITTLFVTSRTRNAKMPNVPTAKEVGLPKLEAMDWFGIFAKSGTPAAKIDEWRGIIAKVVSSPGYQTSVSGMGYTVPKLQMINFQPSIELDKTTWADRVRLSGFKATD